MANSPLEVLGFLAGTAGVAYATFVTVSFLEVQKKVQANELDPSKYYPKQAPKQKPATSTKLKRSGKAG